ncbi:MAG: electron transporter RnfG [Candidatus Cloacimonetes bacterium HGW-Cloacimonetes-3]|jgi:electron transport complex protein RnfG|nr:MAG: electron transporter RnfG [Candidatus Cloacimonetes bacterium HGW-Cloacimonetes-3]
MKYYIKLSLILLVFCAVASGILAYVNSLTEPVIRDRKAKEEIATRSELIPEADFTEAKFADGSLYYIATSTATKDTLGYTFIAAQNGYSGKVQTMVGVDNNLQVIKIKVIDQSETPGLGANCTGDAFQAQFAGLGEADMLVDKDGGKIKSLSGATITTRTIANSIAAQIAALKSARGGR